MSSAPVRLQLSRRKGFSLQALSIATNGRTAVKVTRPGKFGNMFSVHPQHRPGRTWGIPAAGQTYSMPTAEDAVACFDEMLDMPGETADGLRAAIPELKGKNLACWCGLCPAHKSKGKPFDVACADCQPCHSDVLGRRANMTCEAVP